MESMRENNPLPLRGRGEAKEATNRRYRSNSDDDPGVPSSDPSKYSNIKKKMTKTF